MIRLFMMHMGFASLENMPKLVPLQLSDAFIKDLELVDSMPEYVTIIIFLLLRFKYTR